MTVCFGAVWTHECFILLMKMDHITQSSCEDKSLRWCCFDYHAVSVTIWLHPACFFMRRKRYQSSCYWACALAGEQRQSRLAAVQSASSSLTLMTDTSRKTASGHLLCQTADYLSGHTWQAGYMTTGRCQRWAMWSRVAGVILIQNCLNK